MYEPFDAKYDSKEGYSATVVQDVPHQAMRIYSADMDIIITKEQAMKFFGLVDPNTVQPKVVYESSVPRGTMEDPILHTDEWGNKY